MAVLFLKWSGYDAEYKKYTQKKKKVMRVNFNPTVTFDQGSPKELKDPKTKKGSKPKKESKESKVKQAETVKESVKVKEAHIDVVIEETSAMEGRSSDRGLVTVDGQVIASSDGGEIYAVSSDRRGNKRKQKVGEIKNGQFFESGAFKKLAKVVVLGISALVIAKQTGPIGVGLSEALKENGIAQGITSQKVSDLNNVLGAPILESIVTAESGLSEKTQLYQSLRALGVFYTLEELDAYRIEQEERVRVEQSFFKARKADAEKQAREKTICRQPRIVKLVQSVPVVDLVEAPVEVLIDTPVTITIAEDGSTQYSIPSRTLLSVVTPAAESSSECISQLSGIPMKVAEPTPTSDREVESMVIIPTNPPEATETYGDISYGTMEQGSQFLFTGRLISIGKVTIQYAEDLLENGIKIVSTYAPRIITSVVAGTQDVLDSEALARAMTFTRTSSEVVAQNLGKTLRVLGEFGLDLSNGALIKGTELGNLAVVKGGEFAQVAKERSTEFAQVAKDRSVEAIKLASEFSQAATQKGSEVARDLAGATKEFGAKAIIKASEASIASVYLFNVVSEYSIQVLDKLHVSAEEDDHLRDIVKIGIYIEENSPSTERLIDLMNQVWDEVKASPFSRSIITSILNTYNGLEDIDIRNALRLPKGIQLSNTLIDNISEFIKNAPNTIISPSIIIAAKKVLQTPFDNALQDIVGGQPNEQPVAPKIVEIEVNNNAGEEVSQGIEVLPSQEGIVTVFIPSVTFPLRAKPDDGFAGLPRNPEKQFQNTIAPFNPNTQTKMDYNLQFRGSRNQRVTFNPAEGPILKDSPELRSIQSEYDNSWSKIRFSYLYSDLANKSPSSRTLRDNVAYTFVKNLWRKDGYEKPWDKFEMDGLKKTQLDQVKRYNKKITGEQEDETLTSTLLQTPKVLESIGKLTAQLIDKQSSDSPSASEQIKAIPQRVRRLQDKQECYYTESLPDLPDVPTHELGRTANQGERQRQLIPPIPK